VPEPHSARLPDIANSKEVLIQMLPVIQGITDWRQEVIHDKLFELIAHLGLKNGRILFPLRVALSGKTFTPGGGIEICIMLGKEETLNRLNKAVGLL
jgi:glutamyl-tRNA synthetase